MLHVHVYTTSCGEGCDRVSRRVYSCTYISILGERREEGGGRREEGGGRRKEGGKGEEGGERREEGGGGREGQLDMGEERTVNAN